MPQVIEKLIYQRVDFLDVLTSNQILISLTDSIDITETTESTDIYEYISQEIELSQIVRPSNVKWRVTLTDNVSLTQTLHRLFEISLHDDIFFEQMHIQLDFLELTQTLSYSASTILLDTIELEDILTYIRTQGHTLTDTLVLRSNAFGYKITPNVNPREYTYTDPVVITPTSYVALTAGGETITLYRPIFGNQYITYYNHILRESRGKTLIKGKNGTYNYKKYIKSLRLAFHYMKLQEGRQLRDFINRNIGKIITLVDHESQTFEGIITTPAIELVQQDRANYSTEFDFEIVPPETDLVVV